jgi:hypothetical protein
VTDKEKVVLSVTGGLATVAVGYLVWRHEHSITQADAAAQSQMDAANQAAYADQLVQALSSGPVAVGGGASNEQYDNGSTSSITPAAQDSNLAAILEAFFGNGGTTTSTVPTTNPAPAPGQPVATPIKSTPSPIGVSPAPPVFTNPPTMQPVGPSYPVARPVGPTLPIMRGY